MAGSGNTKTGGRVAGTPNKLTSVVKEAILEAAIAAGGDEGLVGFLTQQAKNDPARFMPLLTKLIPIQEVEERRRRLNAPIRFEL
jgi:hypothetical protein|tara:strand:+ start:4691 stop:4945 length:255 start_codon:yes stop_codon:yes gene_type:complete